MQSSAAEPDRGRTRPRKRAELIAAALREEIVRDVLAGRLAEGDPLPSEKEMLRRFDVARPTFREAMRLLEAESLVELRVGQKGGAFVRMPDTAVAAAHVALLLQLRGATFDDVWGLRAMLEPTAARLVAADPTPEGIAELRKLTELAADAVDDVARLVEATGRFRDALVAQAGSETLRLICALLHDIVAADATTAARTIRRPESMSLERFNSLAVRAQLRLVDLIEAGDADGAETFWRRHMLAFDELITGDRSRKRLIDAVATFGRVG